jgi:hypothetical protein
VSGIIRQHMSIWASLRLRNVSCKFLDLTCKVGGTRRKTADHIESSFRVFGGLTNLPVMDFTMIEVTNP